VRAFEASTTMRAPADRVWQVPSFTRFANRLMARAETA
jgi:hypothetical protein